jgi:hypothetical protein
MGELKVKAIHSNHPGECDHSMKRAIEVNRPYLRGDVADFVA